MELLVFLGLAAMLFVAWKAVSTAKRTSQETNSLQHGTMFPGFSVDARTAYGEQVAALDFEKRSIALIRANYWAPHPVEERTHCYEATVRLEASDVAGIRPNQWVNGSATAFEISLTREIPRDNEQRKLLINGHPTEVSAFIEEVRRTLQLPE